MENYRVIIAGSRSFSNYKFLKEQCQAILLEKMRTHQVIIVSGHARGADVLGERFAKEFGLPVELYPARWNALGKGAGMVRNAQMAKVSDALIAFWDGHSRGTEHMINFAKRRGLDVTIIGNGVNPCQEEHPLQDVPSENEKQQTIDRSMNRRR